MSAAAGAAAGWARGGNGATTGTGARYSVRATMSASVYSTGTDGSLRSAGSATDVAATRTLSSCTGRPVSSWS